MKQGKLFVVSGPSGTGKGTVCGRILDDRENTIYSVSMTTREPREGEEDGKEYFFTDKEKFLKMIDDGEFLEHAQVYGQHYGTPKAFVADMLKNGKNVILELDVQGAMSVRKEEPDAVLIFILPPSVAELERRISGRGTESPESKARRLSEAINEISCADKYDYIVINDDLDKAVEEVKAIMTAEQLKVTESSAGVIEKYKEES